MYATDDDSSFQTLANDVRLYLSSVEDPGEIPLAYVNLRKSGRLDLISRIMDAGGYIEVSRRLDLPVDESKFVASPPASTVFGKPLFDEKDENASLAIGRDLEARLEQIEDVDMSSVDVGGVGSRPQRTRASTTVPSGEQLRWENENMTVPVVDEPIPEGELFALTTGMRLGFLALVALSAVGFGRTSVGLVAPEVVDACKGLACGLATAHVVLSVYAGSMVAPKLDRNALLWSLKVLLSGPIGLSTLRALPSLTGVE